MLEQIVRPFQTPTTIADKATPITTPVKAAPQKATLSWGSVGQAPTLFSINYQIEGTGKRFKEKSRRTTDVRIQNPDDPNQYIIAQRINSIEFTSMQAATSASDSSSGNTAYNSKAALTTINSPTVSDNKPNASAAQLVTDTYALNQPNP